MERFSVYKFNSNQQGCHWAQVGSEKAGAMASLLGAWAGDRATAFSEQGQCLEWAGAGPSMHRVECSLVGGPRPRAVVALAWARVFALAVLEP